MKNYEYPIKENTRYSVLFGMDSIFYLCKQIHNSVSVKLLLKIKNMAFIKIIKK